MSREVVLALAVLAVVGGVAAVYYYYAGPETALPSGSSQEAVEGTDYSALAAETLSFWEGLKDENGDIPLAVECIAGSECVLVGAEFPTTLDSLSVSYREAYVETGEKRYADLSREAYAALERACAPSGLCGVSGFEASLQAYVFDADSSAKEDVISSRDRWVEIGRSDLPEANIMAASRLIWIYHLDGDAETLEIAKSKLDEAKAARVAVVPAGLDGTEVVSSYECAIQSLNLEFYGVTGEQAYLDDAKSYLDSTDFAKLASGATSMSVLRDCSYALVQAAKLTGDASYAAKAEAVADVAIERFWDGAEPKIDGSGGFVSGSGPYFQMTKKSEENLDMVPVLFYLGSLKEAA